MSKYPFPYEYIRRDSTAKLMLCPSEADVQAAILDYLNHSGVVAWAVDAGAKALRGRAVGLARKLGADKGALAAMNRGRSGAAARGVSDVVGILPGGRALLLEVKQPAWITTSKSTGGLIQKKPAGVPSDAQLAFLLAGHQAGALVAVVWSVEDVKKLFLSQGIDLSMG